MAENIPDVTINVGHDPSHSANSTKPTAILLDHMGYFVEFMTLDQEGMGRLYEKTDRILIDSTMSPQRQKLVFLHEIAHTWGLSNTFDDTEKGMEALARSMLDFIQTNPAAIEWLRRK